MLAAIHPEYATSKPTSLCSTISITTPEGRRRCHAGDTLESEPKEDVEDDSFTVPTSGSEDDAEPMSNGGLIALHSRSIVRTMPLIRNLVDHLETKVNW